ncbi:MAG: arylsulfatase [Bacilli bacterium]|nr:arylsulfatase [Bacilli bacterium]
MFVKKNVQLLLAIAALSVPTVKEGLPFEVKENVLPVDKGTKKKPNILLILADDMGYSDIGCFGGMIDTPNIDSLAENGTRLRSFTNTARCSPSRASILTGQHPYDSEIYNLPEWDIRQNGGYLGKDVVTIAEVLKDDGYNTFMTGKWHLSKDIGVDVMDHGDSWPLKRGFDNFYGTIPGGGSYFTPYSVWDNERKIDDEIKEDPNFYYTDAISDKAVEYIKNGSGDEPFFGYVAYTAPHYPLHAKPQDIEKYHGKFDEGWDVLRERKYKKMIEMGLIDKEWGLAGAHPSTNVEKWETRGNKDYLAKCMEIYAAMIDCMDQGIGRILGTLRETGKLDDTLIVFLSDNGASAEGLQNQNYNLDELGTDLSYNSAGAGWASLSCAPFKMFKKFVHNGGIASPFIMQWNNAPVSMEKGSIRKSRAQIIDLMPTFLEATGASYPTSRNGVDILPYVGSSLFPIINEDQPIRDEFFYEHEDCMGVIKGDWKLVRVKGWDWELYNIKEDGTECNNLIDKYPGIAEALRKLYLNWTKTTKNTYGSNLLVNGDFERSANYLAKHDGWYSYAEDEKNMDAEFVETYEPNNGEWRLTHYADYDFETSTCQKLHSLRPGYYQIDFYAKKDTDVNQFEENYFFAKSQEEKRLNIANNGVYSLNRMIFKHDGGDLEIGFVTKAKKGAWVAIDDVKVEYVSELKCQI